MNPGSAYRPGREIARGGMGAVLDARDQKLGRSVAMKVMLRRNASEEEQQRFLQEARVLGQLAHPNIVPVHDVGTDEQGRLFYTMKLVVGVTLHDVIGKLKAGDKDTLAKYPLNALLTIFQKVCDAVAFAHSRGIIHRDLKPQNIMVGEFGEVLVMDWGLAKILPGSAACASLAAPAPGTGPPGTIVMQAITPEAATHASIGEQATVVSTPDTAADQSGSVSSPLVFASSETPVSHLTGSQLTLDGTVMGTPNYMSPEQAAGRIAELDKRSDVFSLGGVLYALLTLRPPVEGKDVNELLARVCRGDITPPALAVGKNLLPHLPDGRVPVALSAVTMKALRHERADRYPTVEKLARDIAAYQGGFATSAEEAGVLTLLRLFLRRHRALSAAAALIVLLTIGFMAKVISSEQKATASAAEAKVEASRATAAEQQAKVDAQRARTAEELAGQKGEAARQALTRAALALAEAAQREGNGPAMQAALNEVPDDRRDSTWRYLLEQSDTSIVRLRLGSSEPVAVAPHPQQPGVFAIVNAHGEVALMEVRTGVRLLAFKPVFPPNTYGLPRVAISPDGERIAVGRNGPGGIAIHSARDGRKLLDYGSPPCDRLEFSADGKLLLQVFASQIHVWDAGSGQAMCSFPPEASGANVRAAFTPDSQHVLVADFNDKAGLPLVRARDGIVVRTVPRKGFIVRALVVRTDGTAIIAGESGGLARIVMQDGRLLWEARLGERRIDHLVPAPDGERLVTALGLPDGRQDIRIWQMNSGRPLQTLLGGSGALSQISVHPLSGELVMAGPNARAWNLTGTPATWTLPGSTDGAAFFGADDLVFASASGSSLALNQLQPGNPVVLWKHPSVNCRLPASSADGRVAAVAQIGGNAPTLLLRRSGAQVEQFATVQLSPGVSVVRLSPTGDRMAAIVAARGEAAIHDPATGQQPVKLEQTDMKRRWDLGWLDGQRLVGLVTARADRGLPGSEEWVVLWDVTTGKVTQTVTNRTAMDVLAIAPDGRRFAEAGADKVVRIRNAATLAVQSEFRAHDGPITALAWHPTKPIVATASEDLSTRLWNLDTGERLEELRGPVMPPVGLAFSPGGQRLTCAVKGDKTHIWEPVSLNPKAKQDSGNKTTDGWENLLAQLTPAVVTSMGDGWRMGGGVIFSTGATGPGRKSLPLPGDFSAASYQVRVKLRRLVPRDFFHLALPVGDRQVGFVLDGSPAQGFYTGLSQVNGRQGKESPGAIQGLQVGDTESHELEVTVRLAGAQAAIAVTLDGQPLYEWAGPLSSLSQGSYWKTPPGVLALGTGAADWVVYEVKVKRLDGK